MGETTGSAEESNVTTGNSQEETEEAITKEAASNLDKAAEETGNLQAEVKVEADGQGEPCVDLFDSCEDWAEMGQCQENADFMRAKCPLSCKVCASSLSKEECSDTSAECSELV